MLRKAEDGSWVGTSSGPLDEGFHYYHLDVDGGTFNDPGTLNFYGSRRWESGIEVPAHDADFYALKDVPHGQVRQILFPRRVHRHAAAGVRLHPARLRPRSERALPGALPAARLGRGRDRLGQPGPREPDHGQPDRRGQGAAVHHRHDLRHDQRLTARRARGLASFDIKPFQTVLLDELVPHVDAQFRTIADADHRAMAGLSMGGFETKLITTANVGTFGYVGLFSGGTFSVEDVASAPGFRDKVKLVFVSFGSRELDSRRTAPPGVAPPTRRPIAAALKASGFNSVFYVSPDTAHEFSRGGAACASSHLLLFRD